MNSRTLNAALRVEQDREAAARLIRSVRSRRVRLGISQQTLAGVAGCSLATIRDIEAGPPSLAMARRVDDALADLEAAAASAVRASAPSR